MIAKFLLSQPTTTVCVPDSNPEKVNSLTQTFTFRIREKGVWSDDFKLYYPGLSILGKYFAVTNEPAEPGMAVTSRQYSICYAMNDAISKNLI